MTEDHLGFLREHVIGEWVREGPDLPIEFSRVSGGRRNRALTLVIDRAHGQQNRVWYIRSARRDPRDAACDLRVREGTTTENIGLVCLRQKLVQPGRDGDRDTSRTIEHWAQENEIDAVTWTDLRSNFKDKELRKRSFSVEVAIEHLMGLPAEGQASAIEYVERLVPTEVTTPLRSALMASSWWRSLLEENRGSMGQGR
ncbi:MAG: hypothetical protein AB7T09_37285 [Planctomycetota bacterium]